MLVKVCKTEYGEFGEITDIPEEAIRQNCTYIAARNGQLTRALLRALQATGWWELKAAGFLDPRGRIISEKFLSFDIVYFAHPSRVYRPVRKVYEQLIEAVRKLV